MAGALALDPTLITKSVDALIDVDLSDDVKYGHADVWAEAPGAERHWV